MNTEKLKNNSVPGKNGGARPGAGRPAGKPNQLTVERAAVKQAFLDRVHKVADDLFNAQYSLATGTQMLFVIHTDKKGNRSKPELVTDRGTIIDYLNGDVQDDNQDYYFLTTSQPDNRALDSLLDRGFGKSQQSVDVTTNGQTLEPLYVQFIDAPNATSHSQDHPNT